MQYKYTCTRYHTVYIHFVYVIVCLIVFYVNRGTSIMKMNLLMMQTVPTGNLLIASMSFTNNCRLRNIERLSPVNLSKL